MTKELALTDREKKVLNLVVHRQATDPVNRYLQLPIKGLGGLLVAAVVVVLALSALLGFWLILNRFALPILVGMLAVDAVAARWFQVPVRERLIRKLYTALDQQSAG
jgi:hypothetical protein